MDAARAEGGDAVLPPVTSAAPGIRLDGGFLDGEPSLFVRVVEAERPWAYLALTHASMVHSEYYLPLAVRLAGLGLSVWLPDLRGHGRSSGPRGHVRHWQDHVADVRTVYAAMAKARPHDAVLLAGGESYGGFMTYWAAVSGQIHPDGLILLSPAFRLQYKPPPWLWRLMQGPGRSVTPWLRPWRPLGYEGVSANPAIERMIERDPLAVRNYTLGFLINLIDAQRRLEHAPRPEQFRTLVILSQGDAICDNTAVHRILGSVPAARIITLPGPRHSLVADMPEDVSRVIAEWLGHWSSKDQEASTTP
jgi:alpha-beta hydrolase superfamily lysophospholipase